MVQEGRPRRGSLGFVRKRARSLIPRIRSWPDGEGLQGFVGYKVGMVSVFAEVSNPSSPLTGREIFIPATVIEVPPVILRKVRAYKVTPYGAKIVYEGKDPSKISGDYFRFIVETQPKKAGLPKKKPEFVEIGFGGSAEDAAKLLEEKVDRELKFGDLFAVGDLVDVTAVTKGRGFAGVVKRFGVKLLSHKAEKSRRKVGSIGSWTPAKTLWQVPMAGQLGYFVRTELNKEILAIGEGNVINPKSGWHRYGLIESDFVILHGSIPGPAKRPVRIRRAIRPPKKHYPLRLKEIIVGKEVKKL